ncbi:protease B nonderepressible form, partial [Ascosphaera atra]
MKRRTTFFHQGGGQFDPSQLSLTKDSLTVTDLHAARQERLTFGFGEIPGELATALEGLREVHPPFTEAPGPDTELQQFYQPLPSLDDLANYAQQVICPDKDEACAADLRHLHLADSLDIDYDSTARTLTVTAFWDEAPTDSARWEERISKAQDDKSRVEVGVLALQEPVKPEKLSVGGFLVVVGEHEKL